MWLVGTSKVAGNLPFRLEPGAYLVGRTKSAQIVIADATVSRRHAQITRTSASLTLEDLDSSNGTFVNDSAVSRCELSAGDHVRFGGIACAISSSPLLIRTDRDDLSTFHIPRETDQTAEIVGLTMAQQEIVAHIVQGRSEAEIASLLGKSSHTVHTHLKAVFRRLGVHSRAELIVKVLRSQ